MKKTVFGFKHVIALTFLILTIGLYADRIFEHEIGYILGDRAFTETAPPIGPVRPVAEFEPASHVLIRYPLGIPLALVTHLSNTAQVVTIVSNTSNQNAATTAFTNAGVNMSNVSFMIAATNSYWTRDFGPWFIVDGNDEFGIVDFMYNRPRPSDDAIPSVVAPLLNFNYYGMSLYQTGGNYMTDGINTAAQTQIVHTENTQLTHAQISQKMHAYLGIENFFVINDPNNTYIDHIDCWGKFLAPDKVLIRSVPTTHSQYSEIEAVANFFATTNSAWGYPYRVYRVYTPQNQPYTNSLILNKKVFVPIMNNANDAAALEVYRQALPGYEVIGILGTSSAPWESTDALHCRTHEIADQEMLHIAHHPYRGEYELSEWLDFTVEVKAHSGSPIYSDSTFVAYKINQEDWQRAYLTQLVGSLYNTMITGVAAGDTVRYFIHTADESGRSLDHPLTAALDPHIFYFEGDSVAPVIVHEPITSITNQDTPVFFTAFVSDNQSVSEVSFSYKIDDNPAQNLPMIFMGDDMWSCSYETNFTTEDQFFSYQIIAMDNASPANITVYPAADQWITVPVITTGTTDVSLVEAPASLQNLYPNPFSRRGSKTLNIDYTAKMGQAVEVNIYNVKGQLVRKLSSTVKNTGLNRINWDGKTQDGKTATSGLYILQFNAGQTFSSKKFIIGN